MKPRTHHPAQPPVFEPTDQQIQHTAYLMWDAAGKPAGRDLEIWLAAKERVKHGTPAHVPAPRGPAAGDGLSDESVRAIVAD